MNWNMVGHEWAVDQLRQHVASGRFRHAYLITGPRGVGRRTLALRLAQAVNCQQPPAPGEACYACRACLQLERMQHPDLAVVQAEQVGGVLKVEQVRELQRSLSLAPYEANYRVALLLRFEEAHVSAANALLKTLEEPPARVIVLLTAESAETLPSTIVSRCDVLRLRPLPLETASQALHAQWGLENEQAQLLGHLSGGRPGYAIRLVQDQDALEQRSIVLKLHGDLLKATRLERFNQAEKLTKNKEDRGHLRMVLEIWLSLWRDVWLAAENPQASLTNLDQADQISTISTHLGASRAYSMVITLQRTLALLERNINARHALEVLMLDLPQIK